jgi:DNA mismatch endonuclease, patch repair protein
MDRFSKEERSILMSKIKTTGTDIELALRECVRPLWSVERYRMNVRSLPGKPDIVFPKSRIALFADGDFWHGRGFKTWKDKTSPFWQIKIAANISRDRRDTKALKKLGYTVMRFWGKEIKKYPDKIRLKVFASLCSG